MRRLADVREPASTASHELEINFNEVALAVREYIDTADRKYLERIENDTLDFERHLGNYRRLAQTEAEHAFGVALAERLVQLKGLTGSLVELKSRQEAEFRTVGHNFERLDGMIDGYQSPFGGAATAPLSPRLFLTVDLEADVAELGLWLATFQRTRRAEHRALIEASGREFQSTLGDFKLLALVPDERDWAIALEAVFEHTMAQVRDIVALEDQLRARATEFDRLRVAMDDLLDEEVQALAYAALAAPRREADRATRRVVSALQVLIPVFLLATVGLGLVLVRVMTEPLKRLVRGTAIISGGDLSHRVEGLAGDEFGDLADHFNRMVARLEATTVSKERLEASEVRLRAAVDGLHAEMNERLRAEADRSRLQESLRRNEIMAAMGALVAGVSHEVRNPLFGISSTLDALEARLGPREATHRHIAVLRGEVERLNALMGDLLNYGRTGRTERRTQPVASAIGDALSACAALARAREVTIETRLDADLCLEMDRAGMVQVLRNLLDNALEHTAPGGTVTVETAVEVDAGGAWGHCAVRDAGPGFRNEDLPHIFEPFFSRRRGGTGLGLSIVQRIVDEHHGRVRAANHPSGGAVVTVSLPLAAQRAQAG
jgi:signal transduction histidine kinase